MYFDHSYFQIMSEQQQSDEQAYTYADGDDGGSWMGDDGYGFDNQANSYYMEGYPESVLSKSGLMGMDINTLNPSLQVQIDNPATIDPSVLYNNVEPAQ